MSATAAPPPIVMAGPWKKVAIWLACAIGILGVTLLFTGRISWPWHRAAPMPDTVKIQMNTTPTPVVRPAEPPAALVVTPPAKLPIVPAAVKAPIKDQSEAYNSKIEAYQIKATSNAGTSSAVKVAGSDLPANASPDALEASLTPTTMDGTRVAELPDPRWLIEAGRLLPCIQQTKINSTLPGAVTGIIPEPIRGETGDVILLPKGARVFGTVQHGLLNGLDRLAVLWQHITTPVLYDDRGMPHQFRVTVNSPASSDLGETGVDGDVDRHMGKKLGGIIGIGFVEALTSAGSQALANSTQRNGNNNTSINFNQVGQSGNNAADELLRQWINIPDIIVRNQGLTCAVYVVRDLDMHGAYRLQQQYGAAR